MTTCRIYGLNVSSPFTLGHLAPGGKGDIRITVDDKLKPAGHDEDPPGRSIASWFADRPLYSLVDRGEDGFLCRFYKFADIHIARNKRDVHCQFFEGALFDMLPVILTGNVMAMLLLLRGDLVFHASAIEREGRAVAVVGNSGAGKSTLAAMACLAGSRLVTDDVLRVESTGTEVNCWRGAASLRLRPTSRALGDRADWEGEMSPDGRHLLAPKPTELDHLPLDAIFIPRLQHPEHPLVRTALAPMPALFSLIEHPRVQNWTDPATSAEHFAKLATVIERIPVYTLDVPSGLGADRGRFDALSDVLFDRTE